MFVIDDALLLDVLANTAAPQLAEARRHGEMGTTGSWYWRAARAALGGGHGALSRRIEALPPVAQDAVQAGIDDLPPEIVLISLRRLAPIMARLPALPTSSRLKPWLPPASSKPNSSSPPPQGSWKTWPRQPGLGSGW